jgi:M6 family metalloprotease-like protein
MTVASPNLQITQNERSSNSQMVEFVGQGCSGSQWVFALRSLSTGKYVRAGLGTDSLLSAESTGIHGWEKFLVQRHSSRAGAVSLRSIQSQLFVDEGSLKLRAKASLAQNALPLVTFFDYWTNNFDRAWNGIKARSGRQPVLVLPVQWADNPISFHRTTCAANSNTYTLAQLNRMIFGAEAPSVANWFNVNSSGKLQVTSAGVWGARPVAGGTIQPCQVGTAGCDFFPSSVSKANGGNLMVLMAESLRFVDQQVNFAQFDTNGDRIVDPTELTIFHYLTHEKCTTTRGGYQRDIPKFTTNDGVVLADVTAAGAPAAAFSGALHVYVHASLFTANHEMIHAVLGGLDMYSEWSLQTQTKNGGTAAVPDVLYRDTGGAFSNMAQGGRSSTMLDPIFRLKAGWLYPQLAYRSGWYELRSSSATSDALVLHNPQHGVNEYFVLEYRSKTDGAGLPTLDAGSSGIAAFPSPKPFNETLGRAIPEEGLAIWRMAEQPYANAADGRNSDPRHTVQLMPMSGGFSCLDPSKPGNTIPFKDAAGNTVATINNAPAAQTPQTPVLMNPSVPGSVYTISDESTPLALRWVDGSRTGLQISDLTRVGDRLRFHVSIAPLSVVDAPQGIQAWINPWTGGTTRYPANPALLCP